MRFLSSLRSPSKAHEQSLDKVVSSVTLVAYESCSTSYRYFSVCSEFKLMWPSYGAS